MTRRDLLVRALSTGLASGFPKTDTARPNIILIVADDQGWWDIGANGNPHISTPNLDRLASEGVRFTHFYCSPVCSPTRASIMTGRHYQRTGAVDTYKGRDTLDEAEVTLPTLLRTRGYKTACVGKWHLGRYMRYHPQNRGFDQFFGFWQYGFINDYDDTNEFFEGKERVETTGYVTDVLTTRALSFIEQNRSNPFFLYLTYNAPHVPLLVPDSYIQPYVSKGIPLNEARIYAMMTCIDANVAKLTASLAKNGLADSTLLIYMSDNGGVGKHYRAGLRGAKGSCYEGGVRVPFIARWPGKIPAGAVVDAPAQHIDLLPTLCEVAGTAPPAERTIDGKNIASLLRSGKGESPHDYLYHQWNRGRPVLRAVDDDPELKASWSICDRRGFKLHSSGELFNLRSDPGESQDLANAQPQISAELRKEFERWFADVTNRKYSRVPIEIGRPDENPVEIDLTWADAVGKVVPQYRSYNRDTTEQWSSPEDYLTWKIDVATPGEYEWTVSYGCETEGGGSRTKLQFGKASAEYTFQPTSGRMVFVTRPAGLLKLTRGPGLLELRAAHIAGKQMPAIHKIWLRRVGPTSA